MKLNLIQIQTTSHCNGRCIMCPYKDSWFVKNSGVMKEELYNQILDDIIEYDPAFAGKFCPYLCNEPFADKNIVSRIEQAIEVLPNPFIELSTNLTLVSGEQIDQLVNLYEKNKWNGRIMVSHHGLTKDSYERIMGLKYGVALENLKYLLQKINKRLSVWIHTAYMSHDSKYHMTTPLEIRRFWMGFLYDNDLFGNNITIFPLKFHSRAGNVKLAGWEYDTTSRQLNGCPRVNGQLHVIYTGEVVLCCCDYQHETVIGDLNNQSISEIYNSETWKRYRDMVNGKLPAPDDFLCKRCQLLGA